MKLWLISQEESKGYGTFDSAVVAAETEEAARNILPAFWSHWTDGPYSRAWASSPANVTARELGIANADIKAGVILASFNAG